jgi:hypothetical protein
VSSISAHLRSHPSRPLLIPSNLIFFLLCSWDDIKAPGNFGLEQAYDFTDALGVAGWLNVLVRQSKSVGIACIAQSVNVMYVSCVSPFSSEI